MASLIKDRSTAKNPDRRRDTWRVFFLMGTNKKTDRRVIRLGAIDKKAALKIKGYIEDLVDWKRRAVALPASTQEWIAAIDDEFHAKFVNAGLVPPRSATSLRGFIQSYIDGRADGDIEQSTRISMQQMLRRLLEACPAVDEKKPDVVPQSYFNPEMPIRHFTAADADKLFEYLKREYAEATAARTIKRIRQFFAAAMRARLITENPLSHIKPGAMDNRERLFFITREMTQRLIDACPNAQWRCLIALCRFGALRCPSEVLALQWENVAWDLRKFLVHSKKQKKDRNKAKRWVPIFDELLEYLEDAHKQASYPIKGPVITLADCTAVNLRTQLERIILRAGLTPWPRLFQNMRSTRETELIKDKDNPLSLVAVCQMIGNSPKVALQHYNQNLTDEELMQAATGGRNSVHRKAHSQANESREIRTPQRNVLQESLINVTSGNTEELHGIPVYNPTDGPGGTNSVSDTSNFSRSEVEAGEKFRAPEGAPDPVQQILAFIRTLSPEDLERFDAAYGELCEVARG